ncbi:MFS transporter [Ruegeria jejuensis]|uniref:MFS transporter n=1 Tax=Ruegeria jejuensis TaxID=3233338 RepID=UPI00355C8281
MNDTNTPEPALKRWQRAVYGLPYLGYSIASLPVVAFVPAFYASERGLDIGAIGLILALTRITDVFTDPAVGWASDRLRTPIGRRKPVSLIGLPLLCISVWMLFVPAEQVGIWYVFVWSALLYFSFTLVDLPFKAFGAELSPRYDERAELAGWREALGLAGTAIGLCAAVYIALQGSGELGDQMYALALIAVVSTPILFAITFSILREPEIQEEEARVSSWSKTAKHIFKNGAFRLLIMASFLVLAAEFGSSALKALILEQVYDDKDIFPVLMLAELIVMVLATPSWLLFSKRYSKHQAIAIAALVGGVVSLLIPFVASSSLIVFCALSLVKAVCVGSFVVFFNGIAADVIDIDTARTGETKTGIYFALWGMVIKGAIAGGVLVATNLPALLGYQVVDGEVFNPSALLWVFGFLPGIAFILVCPIMLSWPLTRERQTRLRAAIDRRTLRRMNG